MERERRGSVRSDGRRSSRSRRGSEGGGSDRRRSRRRSSQGSAPGAYSDFPRLSFGSAGPSTGLTRQGATGEWHIPPDLRRGRTPVYRETRGSQERRRSLGSGGYPGAFQGPPSGNPYIPGVMGGGFYPNVDIPIPPFPTAREAEAGGGAIQLIPTDGPGGSMVGSDGSSQRHQRWYFMWPSGAPKPKKEASLRKPPRTPTTQLVTVTRDPWGGTPQEGMLDQQFIAVNDWDRLVKNKIPTMVPVNGRPPRSLRKKRSSSSSCCDKDRITKKDLLNIILEMKKPSCPYGTIPISSRPQTGAAAGTGAGSAPPSAGGACCAPLSLWDDALCPLDIASALEPEELRMRFGCGGRNMRDPVARMGMEAIVQLGMNSRRNMEMEPLRHLVHAFQNNNQPTPAVCNSPTSAPMWTQTSPVAGPGPYPYNPPPKQEEPKPVEPPAPPRPVVQETQTPEFIADLDPNLCPYCGVGVYVKRTSLTGYLTAILCFPCGLCCCLSKKCCVITECTYCHAVSNRRKVEDMMKECNEECKEEKAEAQGDSQK